MSRNFNFITSDNQKINFTVYGESNISPKCCIIYVHGFKGFKDWGFVPYIGNYFSKKNYLVLTFNFSHNGIGQNKLEFTELEKFAQNTFTLELQELIEVINSYSKGVFDLPKTQNIALLGHSRGGAIALLASENTNVKFLVTWAAVANFDRYSEKQKSEWRKKGRFEVMNMRTKQVMKLNLSLLNDLEQHSDTKLNIRRAAKNMNKPWLIIHGSEDLAVKVNEAELLKELSGNKTTELYIIPNTGHTFNAVHPFGGTNEKLENVLEKTDIFFNNCII